MIVDNESFTVLLNPNTLMFSIEQRKPRAEEGWGGPTVTDVVGGPHAAGVGWLVPFLRRIANGEGRG